MSSISWTNTTGGNWNTGANWSGGAEPAAADDVTINTSTSITVTYSTGTDSVLSLYTGSNDTLDMTGGKLAIDGNATFYGALVQSGGTLTLAGRSATVNDGLNQTAGTIDIASGTLTVNTTSALGGTITGATLNLAGGTDTIGASASLSVAELELSGANVTLGQNFSQAGVYQQTAGALAIGSNTLTLLGTTGVLGGIISGSGGHVVLSGATELSNMEFEGSESVTSSGAIAQDASFYIGYNGTDSVSFTNAATGVWRMDGNFDVYGNTNTAIVNQGTLIKASGGGTGYIQDSINSSGTVTVASGDLQFNGANDIFSGTVNGAGTFDLAAGADLLSTGVSLKVANVLVDGAAVTLGGNLAYAGAWSQTSGTVSLGGHSLTLSGPSSLDGGIVTGTGTLVLSAATELSGGAFEGSVVVSNTGTATQSGNFYIGYNGTDTVKFSNAATALYHIEGGNSIYSSTGSSFANAGTFEKTSAGQANVNVSFTNTGTLAVDAGTLLLQGAANSFGATVSGGGTLALNTGADSFAAALKLTVGTVLLEGAVLTVGGKLAYAGSYEQTSGTLSLGKFVMTLSGPASLDGGTLNGSGTLSVKGATVYSYEVEGSTKLLNTGTLTVTNILYDGLNASDTSSVVNSGAKSVLLLADNAEIYGTAGSTLTNAGLIDKASGAATSVIDPSLTSTGTLEVATGILRLSGAANSIAGSVIGAGTLELNAGADTLASATAISVGNLLLDGATLDLGGALTYAGSLQETTGTLALGGNDLSLSGRVNLSGGYITGTGTLSSSGTATIQGGALSGSVVMQNSGTLVQSGSWYVGYNGGDTAKLLNLAGGTVKLQNNTTMYGQGGDAFTNAGTVLKTGGGNTAIQASMATTGTVTIASGQLTVSGAGNTLGGVFNGGGALLLNTGADSISAGTTLGMGALTLSGATVTMGGAETFAGVFSLTGGTLALGGAVLSLTGNETLASGVADGSGTLALSGTTGITAGFAAEGSVVLTNSGTVTDISSWYLGYNSGDTAALHNAAAGTLLMGDAEIYSTAGGVIVNAGTISKALGGAGTGYIAAQVTNTGTISVTQGTLSFLGVVGGAGQFSVGASADLAFGAATSGGTVTLGAFSDLAVSATAGFTDTVAGFSAGDIIDLNGLGYTGSTTTFSFDATHDKLTVSNGSGSLTLQLQGTYTSGSFGVFNDSGVVGIRHT